MKNNIILREYQNSAIEKGLWALDKFKDNSLLVLPTGAGKSIISAGVVEQLQTECLILQPSKEILGQNKNKLALYVDESEIGVYSASFGRKDINKYNFATIQSVYKKPELFNHIGLVLIDECDTLNPRNQGSMFTSFLKAIGNPKVLGMTATPYRHVLSYERLSNGNMLSHTALKLINRMNPRAWNRIVYNINNHELVEEGYLVPLVYESRKIVGHDKIPTNKSRSDFDLEAFEKLLTPAEAEIVEELNKSRKERGAVLVFCTSVAQAERLSLTISKAACVSSNTPMKARDQLTEDFKNGVVEIMFNVGVYGVGFDFPALSCIYNLRPTRSLRIWYQFLGRGTRLAEGKQNCLVIDYTGTLEELGKVEDIILRQEDNKWELYANGLPQHNKALFSRLTDGATGNVKRQIKLGGRSL